MRLGVRTGAVPAQLGPSVFLAIPLWKLATLVKKLAQTSPAASKNAYAALILFPQFHHLRFEPPLRMLKRKWGVSVPKYHIFYDCCRLLTELSSRGDPQTESAARLHLIITMRVFALFRGIGLARTHRPLCEQGGGILCQRQAQGKVGLRAIPGKHHLSSLNLPGSGAE